MIRMLALILLVIGFPAWFVYWISSPHMLVFLYVNMAYVGLLFLVIRWEDVAKHFRSRAR